MDRRKLSSKQKESNERFANANYYAKEVVNDPALKNAALLRLKVLENKLFKALVQEFMLKKGDVEVIG